MAFLLSVGLPNDVHSLFRHPLQPRESLLFVSFSSYSSFSLYYHHLYVGLELQYRGAILSSGPGGVSGGR
jgi:hypothetical protein